MQFAIKDFYDSELRQSIGLSNYVLAIEDNCLIMRVCDKSIGGKYLVLFNKSLIGWYNIKFSETKYIMDSGRYITIETDILSQDGSKYINRNYSLTFIPKQTYNLNLFFSYLNELNKNNLNEEQKKYVEQLLKKKIEENRIIEERRKQKEIEELEAKYKEEEKIKQLELEKTRAEQTELNNFIRHVNSIQTDRELEKMFLNYFERYVDEKFLIESYYLDLAEYLLSNNYLYKKVRKILPEFDKVNLEDNIKKYNHNWFNINKVIEFMRRKYSDLNNESIKLITWIEIYDVAITYYSNIFYELYGKQVGDIQNLTLKDSILKYITSDILNDSYQIRCMFVYYLMSINKFDEEEYDKGYIYCKKIFENHYNLMKDENEYNNFVKSLLTKEEINKKLCTIDDVDLMGGYDFEIFVAEIFKKMGYKTTVTKASGDQGVDVIAEKNGIRYGIQAKRYSAVVSNSAVQEVVAGISFYKCDKAVVLTNNYFTNSAIELAKTNQVILWDRDMLKQKITELYS